MMCARRLLRGSAGLRLQRLTDLDVKLIRGSYYRFCIGCGRGCSTCVVSSFTAYLLGKTNISRCFR